MMNALRKSISGFTLIETMIAVLLTAFITTTLMFGITQTKMYLGSIRVKEQAFIELRNYTNEWKMKLAAGAGIENEANTLNNCGIPQEIVLKEFSNKEIIVGKLDCEIEAANNGDYSKWYDIKTWIIWENNNLFFENSSSDTLEFKTHQILFQTR